jgi:sterol 3beta-glucosyltransferase
MHIAAIAGGSRGDVQPLAVLSQELVRRGHTVRFCAQATFEPLASSLGLPLLKLGGTAAEQVISNIEVRRPKMRITRMIRIMRAPGPRREILDEIQAACRSMDGVVLNSVAAQAAHAAEASRIPYVIAHVSPWHRTGTYPYPALSFRKRQNKIQNLASHVAANQLYWLADRPWVNRWRASLGLPRRGPFFPLLAKLPCPLLFGFSPSVVPRPADWPSHCHVTGYWLPRHSADPEPPESVRRFLSEPAIAVGFGSAVPAAPGFHALVCEAIRLAGQRAIVVEGWSQRTMPNTDQIITVPSIDYRWLFPRVEAAVHAAGAGTCSMALRAGIPSVTVPFGGDQKFWAQRLHDLGVGTPPLGRDAFSAAALADRIRTVMGESRFKQKAQKLSSEIQMENGVETACDIIESYFGAAPRLCQVLGDTI